MPPASMMLALLVGAALLVAPPADTIPGTAWTVDDWRIVEATVRRAAAARVDTLSPGRALATVGRMLVGTPYAPGTLEGRGPERLVVNLRVLDCVTFVDNALALTRFARRDGVAALADPAAARARYEKYLRALRYREGRLDGYASRLHYYSDFLAEQERAGHLRVLGDELGAMLDRRPIDFLTRNAATIPALADPATRVRVAAAERALTDGPGRRWIPKGWLPFVERRLEDGDILAMVSNVPGLDVVHVGIAVREADGRVYLLNAPLVGQSVHVSELPLDQHLRARGSQAGVIVARLDTRW
ncbi:MAG: DUF1460 domain-containing protein [Gemmatimonadales bacterium]|nr:DUF1460 domain-containing protein [Gemmatimonadales bacterium]